MRVHHLKCGSFCPHGAKLLQGSGGLRDRAHIICHCLLIEVGDELVLVDTGFGLDDARDPSRLGPARALLGARPAPESTAVERIRALGLDPADVRHILVTHLDLDHAGGLPDFPEAEVHVFAPELEAAQHPRPRERARYRAAHWNHHPRWVRHSGGGGDDWFGFESVRVLPGLDAEVAMVPLVGHTRGHTGIAVRDGDRWLLHCGDAYFTRGEIATPPSCPPGMRFFETANAADNRSRRANAERLRQLAADHGDEVDLFCAHDPGELSERAGDPGSGSGAATGTAS